jgi:hypothetical protein
VETIPGMKEEDEENDGGGEFNCVIRILVNVTMQQ